MAYHGSFMDHWKALKSKIDKSKSLSGINSVSKTGYILAQGIGADITGAPSDSEGMSTIENGSVFTLTMCENDDEFGGLFLSDTFVSLDGKINSIGGEGGCRIHNAPDSR
jgi:hypothetical protein